MTTKMHAESVTIIKLSQAAQACRELMETERQEKVRNTPLFLGPPGQGKSAIVEQFVDLLNTERQEQYNKAISLGETVEEANRIAGAEWGCISYRLAQCDPTDLKGVPVYINVDGAEMCSFAPPQIFPMEGLPKSAGGKNMIIFLDELPQANPTIQNLAANIIDGKVGDYTIDMERSFVICAGNRKQDHAATYDIPRNVGNRLVRFDVKTGWNEWEEWAINIGKIHPMVVGYLKDKQHFFNEPPPEEGYVYGTPRSWHKVSSQMKYMQERWFDEHGLGLYLAQGTVGIASATAFYQFAKAMRNSYSVDDIMAGKSVKVPTTEQRDILFSLVLEATYRINHWIDDVISHPSYMTVSHTDTTKRVDALVKILGSNKVEGITNMYNWLTKKGIDPGFQVLINKYQSDTTKDNLRIAMMLHPKFSDAADAYEQINKALIAMK